MFFNFYPYSNLHEINLDWILREVAKFKEVSDDLPEYLENAILQFVQTHPEYVTFVQDGAITYPKFNSNVLTTADDVQTLSDGENVENKVVSVDTLADIINTMTAQYISIPTSSWILNSGIYSATINIDGFKLSNKIIGISPRALLYSNTIASYSVWYRAIATANGVIFYSKTAPTTSLSLQIICLPGATSPHEYYYNPLYNPIYNYSGTNAYIASGLITGAITADSATLNGELKASNINASGAVSGASAAITNELSAGYATIPGAINGGTYRVIGHSSDVGSVITASNTDGMSFDGTTNANLCSIDIPTGTWVVMANTICNRVTTDVTLACGLSTTINNIFDRISAHVYYYAANTIPRFGTSGIMHATEPTTLYFNAGSFSTETVSTVENTIIAARIA